MDEFQGISKMSNDERKTIKLGFNVTMEEVIESMRDFQRKMNNAIDFQNSETPNKFHPDLP